MRHWIFQANPKHYHIDEALAELDQIWWRCPQHPGDIAVGDIVLIWRSGRAAGIVGVGRVAATPRLMSSAADNDRFVIHDDEAVDDTTRVLLAVRPTELVAKDRVAAIPELAEHRIITAPMGTVFPLSAEEWSAIRSTVADPPAVESHGRDILPPAFAWGDRAKGVLPMPGGYDGYLDSVRAVLERVAERRPSVEQLPGILESDFRIAPTAARLRASFLRKVGLIAVQSGSCVVGEWAQHWMEGGNDDIVTALLHSRCQLIGELLGELTEPRTTGELLTLVNEQYGMGWDTSTQVDNRRGWLQSAGHIRSENGYLQLTEAGSRLVDQLELYVPPAEPNTSADIMNAADAGIAGEPDTPAVVSPGVAVADEIAAELTSASVASDDPDRFERAVRDAFAFLGFEAELLGGSGRTDVLLTAPLARGSTYRVAVDAKTTASGSLSDQQVDWATLAEHRAKHETDYSLLVGPDPHAGRLAERAISFNVAVISAKQLAGLCRQHHRVPLGLEDYRLLFTAGGPVDTAELDECAESSQRVLELASAICQAITDHAPNTGPLTARDLWLTLSISAPDLAFGDEEVTEVLSGLANPLIAALVGDPEHGYTLATDPRVISLRLERLSEALSR